MGFVRAGQSFTSQDLESCILEQGRSSGPGMLHAVRGACFLGFRVYGLHVADILAT